MISIFKIILNNFGINDLLFNIIAFGVGLIMMRKNTMETFVSFLVIPMTFALATPYLNFDLGFSFLQKITHGLAMGSFMVIGMFVGRRIIRRPVIVPKDRWFFEIEGSYLYMVVLVFIWLTRIFFVLLKEFWPVFYQQSWMLEFYICQALFGIIMGRSLAIFDTWRKASWVSI